MYVYIFFQSDKTDWSLGTGSKTSHDWSTPSSGAKKPDDEDSLGLDWGPAKQSVEDPDDELKLEWYFTSFFCEIHSGPGNF